jgi:hypothetical protein
MFEYVLGRCDCYMGFATTGPEADMAYATEILPAGSGRHCATGPVFLLPWFENEGGRSN